MINRPSIDARAAWQGDARVCRKLYIQFATTFRGSFTAVRQYYGWRRESMLKALKLGRHI